MLEKIFSGEMADMSRFSVPGLIVMALGVLLSAFARQLADGCRKKAEHRVRGGAAQDRKAGLCEFAGKHENLYFVFKIGGLLITVLSFVMIMTVYGRFFKLYLYTAIAPIPLATFAGEPTQSVGIAFIKSYASVCLEGAIIVLGCIIFSLFAATPPVVNADAAAVSMVWSYVGEVIFNMLILVGTVKMADRVVREMMGL